MKTIALQLLLQLFLILLNAVFACAEIAFLSMNEAKIAQLSPKKSKKLAKLKKLTDRPEKFLATIQVAITLAGFIGSAFAAENFSDKLVALVYKISPSISIPLSVLDSLAVIVITLLLSFFTILLGELVPKRIAMKNPDKLALALVSLISFISTVFAPAVWLLTVSTNGILRLFGINPTDDEEKVTEEEIRLMVDAGTEDGTIDAEEKEIIQNVFEFNDTSAGEIATHRTDMILLCNEDSDGEWADVIKNSRFNFYPIYSESVDKIVGVLNAKDYFRLDDRSRDNVIKNAVKSPYLVPETISADVLLKNMKIRKEYFAIVIDEYGGTRGIVTLKDLLQCIVGDIDENDSPDSTDASPDIEKIDDSTFSVSGLALISDVEKAIGRTLDEHDCDTIGGYILGVIASIPEDGTTLTAENDILSINITEVKDHRIERAIITLKLLEEEENE